MALPHAGHACVSLDGARILVVGGRSGAAESSNVGEIYDAAHNSWSLVGPMTTARAGATASVLKNGLVLIAGGVNGGGALASLETYDPVGNRFDYVGAALSSPRQDHAAAVLRDDAS